MRIFLWSEEAKKRWEKTNRSCSQYQMSCHWILFSNEDQNPSPEHVNDYRRVPTDGGVEHEYYSYDYAGHAFQSFNI